VSFGRTALLCSLIIVFASTLPVLGSPAGAANDTYIPACLNLVGTTQTLRIDGTGVPSLPKDQVTAFVAHVANERQLALPEVVVASTNSTELEFTWPGSGPLTIGVPSTAITLSERQFVQVGTVAVTIGARLNRSAAPNIAPGPEGEVERVARALDVGEGMVASIRVMQRMRGGISTSSMSGVRLALGNVRSLTVESLAEATIDLAHEYVAAAWHELLQTPFADLLPAAAPTPYGWSLVRDNRLGFSEVFAGLKLNAASPWKAFAGAREQIWKDQDAVVQSVRFATFPATDRRICNDLLAANKSKGNVAGGQMSVRTDVSFDLRTPTGGGVAVRCQDGEVRLTSGTNHDVVLFLLGDAPAVSVSPSPPKPKPSTNSKANKKRSKSHS
jgi:hypothetical protein